MSERKALRKMWQMFLIVWYFSLKIVTFSPERVCFVEKGMKNCLEYCTLWTYFSHNEGLHLAIAKY